MSAGRTAPGFAARPTPRPEAEPVPRSAPRAGVAFALAYGFVGLLVAALIASILALDDGVFSYTLDDPYIHLSLSEQIRSGGYGVNAGEFSSPSSSILYPFLLAPAARWRIHPYLPLLLNLAALFATLEILRRFLLRLGFAAHPAAARGAALLVALSAIALNLAGLALSGLEHSAHVFLTAALVHALIVFVEEGALAGPLVAASALAPLLRYEALPLSLAALAVLGARGRGRLALLGAAAIAAGLGGFSAFLASLGLPLLPNSVLVKSSVAAQGVEGGALGFALSLAGNAAEMTRHPIGLLLQLAGVVAALLVARQVLRRSEGEGTATLALVLLALVGGHAAAGHFDWFERYEIYAVVAALMLGLRLAREPIRDALSTPGGRALVVLGGAALLAVGGGRYVRATAVAPIAASNIYEQQYQMHRFLTEFHPRPACVNDLGWASYRNEVEVLDLWGLGSERARVLRLHGDTAQGYEQLAREKGADVAILYPERFEGSLPASWIPLAALELSRPRVSAEYAHVVFYATDPARADALRAELRAFAGSLPARLRLQPL